MVRDVELRPHATASVQPHRGPSHDNYEVLHHDIVFRPLLTRTGTSNEEVEAIAATVVTSESGAEDRDGLTEFGGYAQGELISNWPCDGDTKGRTKGQFDISSPVPFNFAVAHFMEHTWVPHVESIQT